MNLDDFPYISQDGEDVVLALKIVPNAPRSSFSGLYGNALKIHLSALAVDGKANKELIAFLSKSLKLPKSSFFLDFGKTSRNKRVRILNVTKSEVAKKVFVLL